MTSMIYVLNTSSIDGIGRNPLDSQEGGDVEDESVPQSLRSLEEEAVEENETADVDIQVLPNFLQVQEFPSLLGVVSQSPRVVDHHSYVKRSPLRI